MPIDTSIYGQVRPFKMEDPYEGASKVLQFRQQQRQFRMEDDVASAAQESGGDPAKMSQLLMGRGQFGPAMQLQTQAATADKERRLARNADTDRQLKILEAAGSDAMTLDAAWRQAMQEAGGNREMALTRIQPIYEPIRAKWAQMGHAGPAQFDPDANFASIGQAREAVQYLKTLASEKTPPTQPTELKRLQDERDAIAKSNPQDPRVAQYDRVLAGYKAGRGETNVTVNSGAMTPGKGAANKIDESILDTTKGLMRLDTIASQFKPEYQEILTKASALGNSWREKLGGTLTNKQKADLEGFSKYKRNAIDSMNEYIKSITGAAMSEAEAQRILRGMPNPGQGLFDGDSPTEFKAKLEDAIAQTKRAVARLAYLKRNGMSLEDGLGKGVTLDGMPQLINDRGKELESQLRGEQPNADQKALQRAVRRQLGIEFGLVSD